MNADERKMPDALRREYDEVMRRMWGAWLRRSGREGGQGASFRLHKLLMQAVKDARGPLDPASIDLISRVLRVLKGQLGTESVILLPDMVAASPASQELGQSLEKAERAVGSPDGESSGGEKNTSDSPAFQKLAQALGSRAKPAVASGDRDDSRDKPIGFEALFKNIAHLAKTPVGAYIVTQLVKKIGDSILASGESIFASLARQPAA